MSLNWKSGGSRSLIFLIVVFVCGGSDIYSAKQFASATPNEKTATAQVVSVDYHIFRYLRFDFYSCSYNFGPYHIEFGECPQGIVDDAVKGKYSGSAGVPTGANVTVYYDPSDPSVNSLLEFSAASESYYRKAASLMCVGALIILFFVFGRLLAANEKRGRGGVVIDARGTVIYPEEIGLGSESFRLPNGPAANSDSASVLRELYLGVVNKIHPDRAANEVDRMLRERLMKEANAAFEHGDSETLRTILEEYRGAISAS